MKCGLWPMRPRHSPGLQTRIKVHKVIWLVATQECGTALAAAFVASVISDRSISWFTCSFFISLDYLVWWFSNRLTYYEFDRYNYASKSVPEFFFVLT